MTQISSRKVIALKPNRRKVKKRGINGGLIGLVVCATMGFGLFLAFQPNAYQVIIQEKSIGAIKDKKILAEAQETVKLQLETLYGTEVKFEEEVELKRYRAKKRDYIDPSYLMTYMRKNMNVLIAFQEIYVEGKVIGIVASEKDVEELKGALKEQYYGNKEVEVEFGKKVETKQTFAKEDELIQKDVLVEKCMSTTPKIIEYEVKSGDSLWGIATKLGVTTENLINENPQFEEKAILKIGEMIKVKINEPLLPLIIVETQLTEETAKKEE